MYLNKSKDKLTLKNPTLFYPECDKCAESVISHECQGSMTLCAFVASERQYEAIQDLANQIGDVHNDYRTTYKELYHLLRMRRMSSKEATRMHETKVNP